MGNFLLLIGRFLLIVLPVLVVCFMLIFTLYIVYNRRRYAHIPQPKIRSFYGGHLGILSRETDITSSTSIVEDWIKSYGSVICLHTYHISRVLVYDPAIVKETLTNTKHKKPRYKWFEYIFGERFLGRGVLTETDHSLWTLKRTRLNKAFHKSSLKQMIGQFDTCAGNFIDYMKQFSDGKIVRMVDKFVLFTEDIIAKVGFTLDLGVYSEDGRTFDQAMTDTFRLAWIHLMPQWFSYPPFGKGLKQRAKSKAACQLIRNLGRECILKRLEDLKNNKETPIDLLHYILQEYMMDDSLLSHDLFENILDEFTTFFVAGNETTSSLLSFTLLLLGKHPDVQKKVQWEIDDIIGDKEKVEYQDIQNLKYVTMVLKEVLRLHPPVNSSVRISSSELILNGHKCPKGTLIQCPHLSMSRLERFYKNPLEFHPERWNEKTENVNFNYQYFPFSAGPRTCIGKEFALIEARMMIAKLMQSFKIHLEDQGYDYATIGGTTLPRDGCLVTLTLRH